MRNVSKYNFIRKMPNQTLRAKYFPPKSKRDIEEIYKNQSYEDLSPDEIKALYSSNFIEDYNGEQWENQYQSFRYKDGTEDVYTKSGYEHEIFEYLDRTLGNKRRYRILTDQTNIDFLAGGRVELDGNYYEILKVINMTNDIPTQNKFRTRPNIKSPHKLAPKIIALVWYYGKF